MTRLVRPTPGPYRLFRYRGAWIPLIQQARDYTPGILHIPELARRFALVARDIQILEPVESIPEDFETNRIPIPPAVLTPEQVEDASVRANRLPPFDQIDTLVDTEFASFTAAQRDYLKRLGKSTRALERRVYGR